MSRGKDSMRYLVGVLQAKVASSIRNIRLLGLLLLISALSLGAACGSSFEGQILIVSDLDGDSEIFLLNPVDGEMSRLTNNEAQDFSPRWSPDGKRIIYLSDESGVLQINQMDLDQETVRQMTNITNLEGPPLWSPNGEGFVFTSGQDGQLEIYWMGAQDGTPTRVTDNSLTERLGDWSPDGQWLVFSSDIPEEERGLWVRNPDGVNLIRLTQGMDSQPVFSPDGRRIAFSRTQQGNSDIYVLKRPDDGTWRDPVESTRLTQGVAEDSSPVWTHDGKGLMFISFRDGNGEVYLMRADGARQERLTSNTADDINPVWSADGSSIAFVSFLYGKGEIFVMNADGTRQRRLTNNEANDLEPDW